MKIGWHILKNGYLLTITGAEGKEEKPPGLMSNGPESVLKKGSHTRLMKTRKAPYIQEDRFCWRMHDYITKKVPVCAAQPASMLHHGMHVRAKGLQAVHASTDQRSINGSGVPYCE